MARARESGDGRVARARRVSPGELRPAEVSARPTRFIGLSAEHDNQAWQRLSALAKCALRYYRYCCGHKMSAGR
jgi:hypothetical protein